MKCRINEVTPEHYLVELLGPVEELRAAVKKFPQGVEFFHPDDPFAIYDASRFFDLTAKLYFDSVHMVFVAKSLDDAVLIKMLT